MGFFVSRMIASPSKRKQKSEGGGGGRGRGGQGLRESGVARSKCVNSESTKCTRSQI